jgi:hypothetical protein
MPLIDEQTRRTDRRPGSPWPWVIVVVVISVLWIALSVLISTFRSMRENQPPPPPPAPAALAKVSPAAAAGVLQQARATAGYGDHASAAASIRSIPSNAPLSIDDKHTYFRIGAESLTRAGSPREGAALYERYLSWSVQVGKAQCRRCHDANTGIFPQKASDMTGSALGDSYATALSLAGTLEETRNRLKAQVKARPADPQLHLLLYHLETALENAQAAEQHRKKLAALTQG